MGELPGWDCIQKGILWTPKSRQAAPRFTDRSILIAVMGMTGSGKTTFISKATRTEMEVGHDLKSCTKEVQIASTVIDGRDVHLIDTPGFDDTELTDSDILVRIATYLRKGNIRLSGILYLHPIQTIRVGGAAAKNLKLFQTLVGKDNMRNVKLVTTMWDKLPREERGVGEQNVKLLEKDFWDEMMTAGAQVDRCEDPASDGYRIICSVLTTSPVTLQLQKEMIAGLAVDETTAGKFVMGELNKLRKQHERDIQELRELVADASMHRDIVAAIREECKQKIKRLEEAAEEARKFHEASLEMLRKENASRCVIL